MHMNEHDDLPARDEETTSQRELPPGPEATESEVLRAELEEAERERGQFRNLLQRVQADFANYRRRTEDEQREFQQTANAGLLLRLLPVLDDLERALSHGTGPSGTVDPGWFEGVQLIARKFHAALQAEGVERIEAEGKPFDPWEHEVVSYEETASRAQGEVAAVVREGYRLSGRVLRPALVILTRVPGEARPPSDPSTEPGATD